MEPLAPSANRASGFVPGRDTIEVSHFHFVFAQPCPK
jgi:hypothetical protein